MKTETCFNPGDLVTSASGARARVTGVIHHRSGVRLEVEPVPAEPKLPPIPEGWVYVGVQPFTDDSRPQTRNLRALNDWSMELPCWDEGQPYNGCSPGFHYIVRAGSPEAVDLGLSEPKPDFSSLKPGDRVIGTRGELGFVARVGHETICVKWRELSYFEEYYRRDPDGAPIVCGNSPTLAGLAPAQDDTLTRVLEALQPLAELIAGIRKEVRS